MLPPWSAGFTSPKRCPTAWPETIHAAQHETICATPRADRISSRTRSEKLPCHRHAGDLEHVAHQSGLLSEEGRQRLALEEGIVALIVGEIFFPGGRARQPLEQVFPV